MSKYLGNVFCNCLHQNHCALKERNNFRLESANLCEDMKIP